MTVQRFMGQNHPQIILASSSKQRKILMDTLNIEYLVVPAEIDEKAIAGDDYRSRAINIAAAKGEEVRSKYPDSIVIAADSFCFTNGRIYEKPETLDEAKEVLSIFAKKPVNIVTGFYYFDPRKPEPVKDFKECRFQLRELSESELDKYVNENPVLTWAAGYSPAYTEGMAIIDWVKGSFTGFTHGFPMELVVPLLKKSGVQI